MNVYDKNGNLLVAASSWENSNNSNSEMHRYQVFDNQDTWDAAKQYCELLGGHLATITSKEENDYVYQLMRNSGYTSAYFGLSDAEEEGTWKWVTGEPFVYKNWHSGEPNAESKDEDYAMFYYKFTDGTWNDGNFGRSTVGKDKAFICEWDDENECENPSTFTPSRDGNSFVNNNKSSAHGFYGVTNYAIPFSYFLQMYPSFSFFSYDDVTIVARMYDDWDGSCYGIATTMAMNYNGNYDITKLSKTGADCYSKMELPYTNKDFLNVIQYYQLSQYATNSDPDNVGIAYYFNPAYAKNATNKDLSTELHKIVSCCQTNPTKAYVLNIGYKYYDNKEKKMVNGGHSLIAYGYKKGTLSNSQPCHEITLYDCNGSESHILQIAENYQNFWLTTGNGDFVGTTTLNGQSYQYNYFQFLESDSIRASIPSVLKRETKADYMRLVLPATGEYLITTTDGHTIGFDGSCFVGDMEIISSSPILNGTDCSMAFVVKAYDLFDIKSSKEEVDISVTSERGYTEIIAENMDSASVQVGETVTISGNSTSYQAYLSGFEGKNESGLIQVSVGNADGKSTVSTTDGTIVIRSEDELNDVEIYDYKANTDRVSIKMPDSNSYDINHDDFLLEETCPSAKFTDVPDQNNWAHAPIDWAVANGITNGTSSTTFSPNNTCTRGQIVTFLWRAAGKPEPTTTSCAFRDVKPTDYSYKAVLWAVEEGITKGTSTTTFSPNKDCTRGQIVTFLWRAKGEPKPSNTNHSFTDIKSGEYYYTAVLWAVEKGVTNGTSETAFSPANSCTRAQAVTFLYRAFN